MSLLSLGCWVRCSKSAVSMSIGIFGLLVGIDNILDFDTNYQFVDHVLSMDEMEPWFSGDDSRAITSPTLHLVGYWLIILGEIAMGALCLAGGALMLLSVLTSVQQFDTGKICFVMGATLGILIWYFGFGVMGGEYFSMWAGKWNGQEKAYMFATFMLIALIYVVQPEPE